MVGEVTRGHLKSSCKVISRDKGDLTKNVDKFVSGIIVKVINLGVWIWRCWQWWNMSERLSKVTNQGHLKR